MNVILLVRYYKYPNGTEQRVNLGVFTNDELGKGKLEEAKEGFLPNLGDGIEVGFEHENFILETGQ